MKEELENKIFEKYPLIFRDRTKSPQETCMCWGLEVGDGWYYLIDLLCESLTYTFTTSLRIDEEDGKKLGIKPYTYQDGEVHYYFKVKPPQVIADQVKEKFGGLRFYYHLEFDEGNTYLIETKKYPELVKINNRYEDYMDGIVHFAETASTHTCEVTGKEGELHVRNGWLKVINPELTKEPPYNDYKLYATPKKD